MENLTPQLRLSLRVRVAFHAFSLVSATVRPLREVGLQRNQEDMKKEFWNPEYQHFNPAGASEILIAEIENLLHVKLPAAYLEVMRVQNGGHASHTAFLVADSDNQISGEDIHWLSAESFHKLEELEPLTEPDQAGWDIHAEQLDLLIAFKQAGACFWCFDYRKSGCQGEPAIVYIDAECEIEATIAPNCKWLLEHLVKDES